MGSFKPIGSEKLEGMDKIRRIIEIARYNENIPKPVNEIKSTEYSISLADGNIYRIVKERQGYIIKISINESEIDYIDNIKSRSYFRSYSQALKRLNLMTKEINVIYENEEGTSLIGEQKKKFILKSKTKSTDDTTTTPTSAQTEPAIPPVPETQTSTLPAIGEPPTDMVPPATNMEEPTTDMVPPATNMEEPPTDMEEPPTDMEEPPTDIEDGEIENDEIEKEPKEKKVSDIKRIQILVGKLAQKIRSYEEDKELSPKEIKYIINSILSAIDVDVLDEDDIEQIIDKLEGTEEENDEEEPSFDDTDEEEVAPEPPTEPEMAEGYDSLNDAFDDYVGGAFSGLGSKGLRREDDEDGNENGDEYHKNRRRNVKRHYSPTETFNHGTYYESSVDKVLSKYLIINESEEKNYQKNKEKKTNQLYNDNKQNVIKLSESSEQLTSALKYIKENLRSKLLGLSNKGNLIFKEGINEIRINKFGKLL